MKISDLQHLEVISEETNIEGGITFGFGSSSQGTAATLVSAATLSAISFAGGTFNSSANTTADSASVFDLQGTSGSASVSSSLSSVSYTSP